MMRRWTRPTPIGPAPQGQRLIDAGLIGTERAAALEHQRDALIITTTVADIVRTSLRSVLMSSPRSYAEHGARASAMQRRARARLRLASALSAR